MSIPSISAEKKGKKLSTQKSQQDRSERKKRSSKRQRRASNDKIPQEQPSNLVLLSARTNRILESSEKTSIPVSSNSRGTKSHRKRGRRKAIHRTPQQIAPDNERNQSSDVSGAIC